MRATILLSFLLVLSVHTNAQENKSEPTAPSKDEKQTVLVLPETVITASRIETSPENVGRAVELRSAQELQQTESTRLTEGLSNVSGVRSFELGGFGSPGLSRVEIRGFPTKGTQLLLDGYTLSDPSSVNGTYEAFISDLNITGIEQMEVLKGGTGVLYGSDGQSGAVNLISKQPKEGKELGAALDFGSLNSYRQSVDFNFGTKTAAANGELSHFTSNGLDAHGDYENSSLSLQGKVKSENEKLTLSPVFRLIDAKSDLDTSPTLAEDGSLITNQDTPSNNVERNSFLLGSKVNYQHNANNETQLKLAYLDNKSDYYFDFGGIPSTSEFSGSSYNTELQNTLLIPSLNSRLASGAEFEHQDYDSTTDGLSQGHQRDQVSLFLANYVTLFEQLELGAGVRLTNISDISQTLPTFEGSLTYNVSQTGSRIHSSIAQGFRAPTLFESKGLMVDFNTGELIDVGNRDLDSEETLSFDIGLEQTIIPDTLILDSTFFVTDSSDSILFDYATMSYYNGDGASWQGLENSLLVQPVSWAYIRAAYTNLYKAEQNGEEFSRREQSPRNWLSLETVIEQKPWTLSLNLRGRSSQDIAFFGEDERYREGGYLIGGASMTFDITKNWSYFIRADNLFDKNYTEGGYEMPGFLVFTGIRFRESSS